MKKIAKILLVLTLALVLIFSAVACDDNDKDNGENGKDVVENDKGKDKESDKTKETEGEKNEVGIFAVKYNGINIELGSKADAVLKKLGEPLSSNFVASCGEATGEQWVYSYSSIFVYTVKNGEDEIIDGIKLRDDIAYTSKSIRIGSTKTNVKNAYTSNLVEKENSLLYTEGVYVIEFTIDANDKVTKIELRTETN